MQLVSRISIGGTDYTQDLAGELELDVPTLPGTTSFGTDGKEHVVSHPRGGLTEILLLVRRGSRLAAWLQRDEIYTEPASEELTITDGNGRTHQFPRFHPRGRPKPAPAGLRFALRA